KCSKGGDPFRCSGILGCWCGDVKLDKATLAALKEQYDNCLCPTCLKAISEAEAAVHASASLFARPPRSPPGYSCCRGRTQPPRRGSWRTQKRCGARFRSA